MAVLLKQPAEPASEAPEFEPSGLTGRALALGALLVPVLCFWNVYSDVVAQSTELAVLSLSIGIVFMLLVLLGINALLRRFLPRRALTAAELLTVYVMQAVSLGISGVGMTQFLCMGLGNVFHYADLQNRWAQNYQPLLPRWAFPDPAALPDFYAGQSTLFTAAHLRGWLSPVLVWSGFVLVLLVSTFCLSALLRRRWVEHERLTFPIVVLPLALIREDSRRALLRSRVFWLGFGAAFALENLAAAGFLIPNVPFVPLKPSDPAFKLGGSGLFTAPPWNAVGELDLGFYPLVIGLTYFLPLDVSCSCWFFYLFRKIEAVLTASWGLHQAGTNGAFSQFPYFGEQGLGGFLGLGLWTLAGLGGYWRQVRRAAFGRQGSGAGDDHEEPLPYRAALVGLGLGLAALAAFGVALGLPWWASLAFLALYLLVVIAYTRIRAEAGLPWAFGPDMTPHQLLIAGAGTVAFSSGGLVGLTQMQWLDLDYRCTVMPAQMEALKIGTEARLNLRHLSGAIALATLVGALASWLAILTCYYHYGAATAHVNDWRTSMGSTPWRILDGWTAQRAPADHARVWAVAFGVCVTGLLVAARTRFLWWPFHPVGYILAGTFTMEWLWCSLFVGWLVKWLVLRYGGLRLYRQALPFFIGLILGDYVAGALWALYGCLTGVQTYRVAPI
jgi:hypothetical protein